MKVHQDCNLYKTNKCVYNIYLLVGVISTRKALLTTTFLVFLVFIMTVIILTFVTLSMWLESLIFNILQCQEYWLTTHQWHKLNDTADCFTVYACRSTWIYCEKVRCINQCMQLCLGSLKQLLHDASAWIQGRNYHTLIERQVVYPSHKSHLLNRKSRRKWRIF